MAWHIVYSFSCWARRQRWKKPQWAQNKRVTLFFFSCKPCAELWVHKLHEGTNYASRCGSSWDLFFSFVQHAVLNTTPMLNNNSQDFMCQNHEKTISYAPYWRAPEYNFDHMVFFKMLLNPSTQVLLHFLFSRWNMAWIHVSNLELWRWIRKWLKLVSFCKFDMYCTYL